MYRRNLCSLLCAPKWSVCLKAHNSAPCNECAREKNQQHARSCIRMTDGESVSSRVFDQKRARASLDGREIEMEINLAMRYGESSLPCWALINPISGVIRATYEINNSQDRTVFLSIPPSFFVWFLIYIPLLRSYLP